MARIPQFQEQNVQIDTSNPYAGSLGETIASVGELISKTGDILERRRLAKDMNQVNELSTDFELTLYDDYLQMQRDKQTNPDGFSKAFIENIDKRKNEFIKNSKLSARGKLTFSKMVESKKNQYGKKSLDYENKQSLINYADSVERVANKNNLLAYRMGQSVDIEGLETIDKKISANALTGVSFLPKNQLDNMIRVQTKNAYSDFIKGLSGSDINLAKKYLEDESFQNKLGDVETIDSLKNYVNSVENRKKQLDNSLINEKSLFKAQQDMNIQTEIKSEFNKFNIGTKNGRSVIKNKAYNNMDDIIQFRQDVKTAYANESLTNEQYDKYVSNTTPVVLDMINKLDVGNKSLFFTSVNEQLAKDIRTQLSDNEQISDSDLASIYEYTYLELQSEGVDLSSTENDDKLNAKNKLKKYLQSYGQLRTGRNDVNSAIVGNSIIPISDNDEGGQNLDNGGYKEVEQDGVFYLIRQDSNGNIIDVKRSN